MDAQAIAAALSGAVAIWAGWRSVEWVKVGETDERTFYEFDLSIELVLVALAASASCVASRWSA